VKREGSAASQWPQLHLNGLSMHLSGQRLAVIKERAHKGNPYFDPISNPDLELKKESILT